MLFCDPCCGGPPSPSCQGPLLAAPDPSMETNGSPASSVKSPSPTSQPLSLPRFCLEGRGRSPGHLSGAAVLPSFNLLPIPPPPGLETMTRRPTLTRLAHVRSGFRELQAIADALSDARKIVVIAGAGISTAAGIPVGRIWRL